MKTRYRIRYDRSITYRKLFDHDFDSIGNWWVYHWDRPTGVIHPWGTLPVEHMMVWRVT